MFFAFSAFVMPALRRLPAVQGIGAMQSINRLAVTAPLMLALFGTAVLSVVAVIWAIRFRGHAAPWMLTGGAAYIVAILITIAGNVPLNNALRRPRSDIASRPRPVAAVRPALDAVESPARRRERGGQRRLHPRRHPRLGIPCLRDCELFGPRRATCRRTHLSFGAPSGGAQIRINSSRIALAERTGHPVLCTGNDFAATDIAVLRPQQTSAEG